MTDCKSCGGENPEDAKYCGKCGKYLIDLFDPIAAPTQIIPMCPRCYMINWGTSIGARYCQFCGFKVY